MAGDTILIKDISINGNDELTGGLNTATSDQLSKTLTDNTINTLGIDASSRTIWINGQPYGNAYVNIKEDNTVEAPIGAEIFNDFEHNIASGDYSHAEGRNTIASGSYSHAEGLRDINKTAKAEGMGSHTEGNNTATTADGRFSHAEGGSTIAQGAFSHAEGFQTETGGEHGANDKSLEGAFTKGSGSHAEGGSTIAQGVFSHAEGELTFAKGTGSHAEGYKTTALGLCSHAEGNNTTAEGFYSHAEGNNTTAKGYSSHAEGNNSKANGHYSHVTGSYNICEGKNSSLQGYYLFDHGIDTKDSFIWLQLPGDNPSISNGTPGSGCGYIIIREQYLVNPETSINDDRVGCYRVTGLYFDRGPRPGSTWVQEIYDDDSHKYYISAEDLNNIIDSWNPELSAELDGFLTPVFNILKYQYNESTQDFELRGYVQVQGCGWLYDERYKENYKQRLKALVEDEETVSEGVIKMQYMYTDKRPNKVPTEFTNNNATIVGKYNKPQPDDIFEVGCGDIDSSLKITQSNAISVSSTGETTIMKLNTRGITAGNANVNTLTSNMVVTKDNANVNTLTSTMVTVTASEQFKSVQQQIAQLPASSEDWCRSIICKDGILIGYSQSKYMFLKIDANGNIILGNRKPAGEQKTKDLSYLFENLAV